ncbi:hypothetical protein J3459_018664 [Metarhizium acridum]|nr:hypothetical protein J3459_018664 [Metarhizium acridum]
MNRISSSYLNHVCSFYHSYHSYHSYSLYYFYSSCSYTPYSATHIRPTTPSLIMKIIGGTNATIDQFPYQASIQRRVHSFDCQFNVHTCGGVIIAPNKILTAAHCVSGDDDGSDRTQFVVRAGSTDWTRGGQLVGVNGITIQPWLQAERGPRQRPRRAHSQTQPHARRQGRNRGPG